MLESEIKSSLQSIKLDNNEKDLIYKNIIKKASKSHEPTKTKLQVVTTFCKKYGVFAAAFVVCVCLFAFYNSNSQIPTADKNQAIGYSLDNNLAKTIDRVIFTAYVPNGDNFTEIPVEIASDNIADIWNSLQEKEVYPQNINLISSTEKDGILVLTFSKELVNYENLDEAIIKSFTGFFEQYSKIEISTEK